MLRHNLPVIRRSKETRDTRDYFEKRENETKDLKGMEPDIKKMLQLMYCKREYRIMR